MNTYKQEQYVCKVCGFNMIGKKPNICPFCGASSSNFISAKQCSIDYKLAKKQISEGIYSLNSTPNLGIEHTAYVISNDERIIWIDCPSTFRKNIDKPNIILFTHHHFIAAANLYQNYFNTKLWIHKEDSDNYIANQYQFDNLFKNDFELDNIIAFHIDGHTNGFTIYLYKHILFICDYVFLHTNDIKFNPYGSRLKTFKGAKLLNRIIKERAITKVCGYNYVSDFEEWYQKFLVLLEKEK